MATYLDELDKQKLTDAVTALRAWHGFQSASNVSDLYNAASRLFNSKFNPAEYDEVE